MINSVKIDLICEIFEIINNAYAVYQTIKFWNFLKTVVVTKNVDEVRIILDV